MLLRSGDLESAESRFRARLINSASGVRSAVLIGTKSIKGTENLAIFSTVFHVGANPPLIGFLMRPVNRVRHTYENISKTGFFTVNHIPYSARAAAHQTAAQYPEHRSEFEACGFSPEYIEDFFAPFCAESPVRSGCSIEYETEIPANGTRLMVGRILWLDVADGLTAPDGFIDLAKAETAAVSGLDGYHKVGRPERYSYPEPERKPKILKP